MTLLLSVVLLQQADRLPGDLLRIRCCRAALVRVRTELRVATVTDPEHRGYRGPQATGMHPMPASRLVRSV